MTLRAAADSYRVIFDLVGALERLTRVDQSLEIEVGSGRGHFAIAQAEAHRDRIILACELKSDRCRSTVERARRARLDNVIVVKARGEELLRQVQMDPRSH